MDSALGHVIDAVPGLVWTAFPDGRIDFLNQRWCEYTGLEVEESRGRGWQAAVHPQDLPGLLAGWRGDGASSAPGEAQVRLRGADGTYRWFLFRAHATADASGRIVKWSGLGTDINERMQAQEALRARENRLRVIVDDLPVLLSTATPDGELDEANRHYLDYFGASLEELKARESVHGLHPDDRPRVLAARKAAIESGRPYEIECRRRRGDGVYRWFHLRAFPLHDAQGRVTLWYRLQVDIEDQKRAEALLAGEKRLLEMVASGRPMSDILAALCRLVESTVGGCSCSIVLLDQDGTKLQEAIAPSLAAEFNDAVRGWPLDRIGGPCVMAARDKLQVIMSDVASDTRWRNGWRALAHKHGLRSCWSTPIASQAGNVLGTFALYQREPGSPNALQLELIAQFTNIASIAIERAQRDAALRQSEARLAEAERELQLTLDTLPALVASYRPDGSRIFVNRTWLDYTGLSAERAVDAERASLAPPEDAGRIEQEWRTALAAGIPFESEMRLRRADGEYRWHTVRRVPARDQTGDIVRWYSVAVDIEERKAAEEALRHSEARRAEAERELQLTIDSIPTLVGTYRPDGSRIFVNRTWRDYTGLTLETAREAERNGFIHPDDAVWATPEWRKSLATGEPFQGEIRLRRADGEYRWHMVHRVAARDGSGAVVKWYSVGADIEQRKRTEEALRQSELSLRSVIDGIPGLVAILAPNGDVEAVNRQIVAYCGRPLEELKDWGTNGTVHDEDMSRVAEIFTKSIASGVPYEIELRLRRFDGAYLWFNNRGVPIRDDAGQIVCWYILLTDIHERKRAEEALRESEARLSQAEGELRLTLDSIPVMVWRGAANGYVQHLNKRWFEYTGTTPEQVRGRRWKQCIHPDDLERHVEIGNQYVAAGTPIDSEARLRRFDGEYRRFLFRPAPLRDETGTIIGWYGTIIDIEDRKRAEEKAIEAERDLQHLIDHIPAMVATYRADGMRLSINKRLRDYIGRAPAEGWERAIRNQRTAILDVHPDDAEVAEKEWRECLATGEPFQQEYRVRRYDGTYRWVMRHRVPVRDETGKVIRWYGLGYEIEDRKRAEEKAAEAERELQRTIDNIPVLVGTYSADGRRLFANKRTLEVTGLTAEDLPDERWRKAFHPDEVAAVEEQWRACVASGEPFEREVRTRTADGTYRWHWTRRVPLRDETGKVIRWYGVSYDIEDRKRAEEELRRSEALLARAQRLSLTGSFSFNPATGEATWSEEVYRIYDYQPGSRVTLSMVRARYHPEDMHLFEEEVAQIRSHATDIDCEHRLLMPDGSIKHVHMVAHGSLNEEGAFEYIGAVQDITQHRHAAVELRRSEAFLAKAQRLSLTGSFSFYSATQEFTWSEELYRIFEFEPGVRVTMELIGSRYHPEDRHVMEEVREGMRRGAPDFDYEHRLLMADGSIKHIRVVAHGTPDKEGAGLEYFGAVQDITQRRIAEDELRRSEAYLAEAQRLAHTGSFVIDYVNRKPIHSSDEHHRLFGFNPADGMPGWREWVERVHPEDRATAWDVLDRSYREKTDFEVNYRVCHPDGSVRYLRVVGHPVLNEAGDVVEFVGTSVDVTQRQLAEDALDKARSELAHVTRVMSLGALTASIAHEVNQPLAGIITNASTCLRMLSANPPNVKGALETARRTIRDGNRAADVITRLRALFSKKAAGTETVELNEATREVLALVFSDLLRNRVFLRAEIDDDHPVQVTGDRVQLQQVILNLVRNAADAMRDVNDRPRHLLVKVEREQEGGARLAVRDAGVGLDPQNLERLFDAFYTTKAEGMGIGLSVSRSIIENHGGRLWAETNDGPGATFSFSIPPPADTATDDRTGAGVWRHQINDGRDAARNS